MVPAQTPGLEGSRAKALDQDVCVGRKPPNPIGVFRVSQVEGDGLGASEKGGEANPYSANLWRHHPHRVAGAGLLDFDQTGTEIEKLTRQHSPGQHAAQIQDQYFQGLDDLADEDAALLDISFDKLLSYSGSSKRLWL